MAKPIIDGYTKDDTIVLECSLPEDISGWKIRCEICDDLNHSIQLATANSGGSTDQIEVTLEQPAKSEFLIKVPSGATHIFADNSASETIQAKIEIEVETGQTIAGKPEILTIFDGFIDFKNQKIDWETPS
jgi:hypothetical protein